VASLENLLAAAREALRGKRSRPPGAAFFADLEHEVAALHRELRTGSYRHGPYRYFEIREPKPRQVAAARFRDRVVHHAIVRVIEPLFEPRFIEDSYACRKRRGTHAAMRRAAAFARRHAYALECDVSRYFASIDHEILLAQVARVVADPRLLALLRQIVESHADGEEAEWTGPGLFDLRVRLRGLPIGNLTSQFLANVYLNPLDHFVKHELRVRGYLRYLDDFLLFGDDRAELRALGRAVKVKLAELRLRMHPDKYRLRPTRLGVDFVGFVVFADGRVRVRRASVRRFERRYRRRRWEVERHGADAEALTASVRSWVAHARHAKSLDLRRAVLGR
jgi:RNA-directed DNA polymerase